MVWRLDRLGASLRDVIEMENRLGSQKAGLVSLTERWTHGLAQAVSSIRFSLRSHSLNVNFSASAPVMDCWPLGHGAG